MAAKGKGVSYVAVAVLVLVFTVFGALGGAAVGGAAGFFLGRRSATVARRVIQRQLEIPLPGFQAPPNGQWQWPNEGPSPEMKATARVIEVVAGSPAESAGVRVGDAIVAVDGKALSPAQGLAQAVSAHKPGDKVELTVEREGTEQKITVTLGESSTEPGQAYLGLRYQMSLGLDIEAPMPGGSSQ